METAIIDRLAGGCEYRPEPRPLLRPNSILAPETRHLGIRLCAVELPGIDHIAPLRQEEACGELGDAKVLRDLGKGIAYQLIRGSVGPATEGKLIKLFGNATEWRDGNTRDNRRFLSNQHFEFRCNMIASGREKVVSKTRD